MFNHANQIIAGELRRKTVRMLVGKLNIISKYPMFFSHIFFGNIFSRKSLC